MKTNESTLTTTWKTTPGSWLLTLLIAEKWWLHVMFVLSSWTFVTLAIYFYTGHTRAGWSGSIPQLIMCIYLGKTLGEVLLLRKLGIFVLGFLSMWMLASLSGLMMLDHYDHLFHDSLLLSLIAVSPVPFVALSLGIFLKLIRHTVRQQYTESTQRQSELDLLLSQLSPHFLFNTLNNLYGLSLTQSQRMPELILKLSDLLRYSVYDARQTFVPLKSELAYINNYIELATTSVGDRLVLTTNMPVVNDPSVRIAPMLLIVFIENAFKHSQNSTAANIYINIRLEVSDKRILFNISNSYNEDATDTITENSGVGIANSIKRLQLLYENAYEYRYEKSDRLYTATLILHLK
ncbi:sensor histidine kinase [Chitinophaga sp.]|uniref:sensor histidine kinase n=1 Tax=Chitinophaga sp. TaxID=1869181 RepID=UPI002F95412C